MLKFNRVAWIGAVCWMLVPGECLHAQLRGGAAADRPGIGGRISARREVREDRRGPVAPPVPLAPRPSVAGRPGAIPAGGVIPIANGQPNTNASGPRANAPQVGGAAQAGSRRSAYYGGAAVNPNAAANVDPSLVTNGRVATASAATARPNTLPPNRLPYTGPGVLIRMPREFRGEVNYLVDNTEHLVIHPGEEQLLSLKGDYQVRFSRGVTSEGRSYGEGYYTISEGVYRFDVTDDGWELYREADATALASRIERLKREESRREESRSEDDEAASYADPSDSSVPLVPAPASERRRPVPPLPSPPASSEPQTELQTKPPADLPAPSAAGSEETLPAPRSILEPS